MADLQTLRTALAVSPDNIPLLLLFAQTALDEWATEEARGAYERVLKQSPSHREAGLGMARALFHEGKPSEAAVRLERLIATQPDFAPALVLMARIHLSEDSRTDAVDAYRRAVEMDKSVMDEGLARELGLDPSGRDPGEVRRVEVHGSGGAGFSAAAAYSEDGGEAWQSFPVQEIELANKVQTGVSALNSTSRPCEVRFKDIQLKN